jgi:hypothetical protein
MLHLFPVTAVLETHITLLAVADSGLSDLAFLSTARPSSGQGSEGRSLEQTENG